MTRFPSSATFELTARCDLRCGMCLVRVDEKRIRELGARELTADEWISLARQAADMGTVNLLITGGEPTLRDDFCRIYEAVMKLGFVITLYTNAVSLSPAVRETLTRYPPHMVGVTVYGASNETYARACGANGGYDRVMEGINFLRELPSRLEVRTTLTRMNIADMDAIRTLALSLGDDVPFVTTQVVTKAVRGGIADAAACRLSPEDNVRMLRDTMSRTLAELRSGCRNARADRIREDVRQAAENKEEASAESIFGCNAGVNEHTVTWDGRLIGCQMMDEKGTAPLDTGLKRAWEDYPSTVEHPVLDEKCSRCEWQQDCMVCPAARLAETGSLSGTPEYNCRMSELIYKIRKNAVKREG